MNFGLAAASLIIVFFVLFVMWGRSPGGQQALLRVFGPARQPARARTQRKRAAPSRASSTRKSGAHSSGKRSSSSSKRAARK